MIVGVCQSDLWQNYPMLTEWIISSMLIEFNDLAWLVGLAILVVLLIALRRAACLPFLFLHLLGVSFGARERNRVPIPLGMDGGFRSGTIWSQMVSMFKFSGLNLIPLYFGNCWGLPRACATGIYENILMTVPFGFGIILLPVSGKGILSGWRLPLDW